MKVNFCLNQIPVVQKKSIIRTSEVQGVKVDTRNSTKGIFLSFTSNPLKNMSQVASIAPEYQGIMNSVYKLGGLGNVAGEASIAFSENGNMDFRSFIPYYAPENKDGGIKVRTPLIENGVQQEWSVPKMVGSTRVMENGEPAMQTIPAYTFKSVPLDYVLQEGEDFVIHEPVHQDKPWNTGYKVIEDTGIKGSVESINENLDGVVQTPYKVFSVKGTEIGKVDSPPVYIIHTPELAKFPKAYGAVGPYGSGTFEDAHYGVFSKAAIDAMPKLNDEKFGDFNPGNFWLHDRQAFPSLIEISEKSANGDEYWRGIKAHSSFHNPGRNYQGHYKNPVDFMRIAGSRDDLIELQKNTQDYNFVKDMVKKIEETRKEGKKFSPEDILSKDEMQKLNEIFKPLYGDFLDETGEYNLCKIPLEGVRKNPYNFSAGTVSTTFGKEMKNHNTTEIAQGLTKDFASTPTVDIVNGSSAKSMNLDVIGNFGKNNGFTDEIKQGFKPLTKEVVSSPDLLFETKQSNKKWIIDTIASHCAKGKEKLQKLFFSESAIKEGSTVIGEFSPYKDKDVLFVGWGRPDPQKGFPTTLEGILEYFKNDSIKPETKEHAKFLIGAGPWSEKAPDWKIIQEKIQSIQKLENGRYKGNICYVNGFFTNRVVACADYANITSRYEPCGITPLEAYAGGTPVISNKTGGSPDFITPFEQGKEITNETGFLTKNAYLVNPEVIGAQKGLKGIELDNARRMALGKENAQCIEQAVDLIQEHPEEYKKMMTNAVNSKIDWHENVTFNGGKSAIERYKECAWSIDSNNKALAGQERNMQPLSNLKGKITFIQKIEDAVQNTKETIQNTAETISSNANIKKSSNSILTSIKGHKGMLLLGTAIVAGIGAMCAVLANKNKSEVVPEKTVEKTVTDTNKASNSTVKTVKQTSFNTFATSVKK